MLSSLVLRDDNYYDADSYLCASVRNSLSLRGQLHRLQRSILHSLRPLNRVDNLRRVHILYFTAPLLRPLQQHTLQSVQTNLPSVFLLNLRKGLFWLSRARSVHGGVHLMFVRNVFGTGAVSGQTQLREICGRAVRGVQEIVYFEGWDLHLC